MILCWLWICLNVSKSREKSYGSTTLTAPQQQQSALDQKSWSAFRVFMAVFKVVSRLPSAGRSASGRSFLPTGGWIILIVGASSPQWQVHRTSHSHTNHLSQISQCRTAATVGMPRRTSRSCSWTPCACAPIGAWSEGLLLFFFLKTVHRKLSVAFPLLWQGWHNGGKVPNLPSCAVAEPLLEEVVAPPISVLARPSGGPPSLSTLRPVGRTDDSGSKQDGAVDQIPASHLVGTQSEGQWILQDCYHLPSMMPLLRRIQSLRMRSLRDRWHQCRRCDFFRLTSCIYRIISQLGSAGKKTIPSLPLSDHGPVWGEVKVFEAPRTLLITARIRLMVNWIEILGLHGRGLNVPVCVPFRVKDLLELVVFLLLDGGASRSSLAKARVRVLCDHLLPFEMLWKLDLKKKPLRASRSRGAWASWPTSTMMAAADTFCLFMVRPRAVKAKFQRTPSTCMLAMSFSGSRRVKQLGPSCWSFWRCLLRGLQVGSVQKLASSWHDVAPHGSLNSTSLSGPAGSGCSSPMLSFCQLFPWLSPRGHPPGSRKHIVADWEIEYSKSNGSQIENSKSHR